MNIPPSGFTGIFCAYIDPNSGGRLFQLIFPLLVAISGFGLVLRKKFAAFWGRLRTRKNKKPDESN